MRLGIRVLIISLVLATMSWGVEIQGYGVNLGLGLSKAIGTDANNMGAYFVDIDDGWSVGGDYWGYTTDYTQEPNAGFAFLVGAFFGIEFFEYFQMRAEVNFANRSAKYTKKLSQEEAYGNPAEREDLQEKLELAGFDTTGMDTEKAERRYEMSIFYADIPILFVAAPIEKWHIYIGPQFSIGLFNRFERHRTQLNGTIQEMTNNTADVSKKSESVDIDINRLQIGLVTGTSVLISDQMELGFRYTKEFRNSITNEDEPNISFQKFELVLSMNFYLW